MCVVNKIQNRLMLFIEIVVAELYGKTRRGILLSYAVSYSKWIVFIINNSILSIETIFFFKTNRKADNGRQYAEWRIRTSMRAIFRLGACGGEVYGFVLSQI